MAVVAMIDEEEGAVAMELCEFSGEFATDWREEELKEKKRVG